MQRSLLLVGLVALLVFAGCSETTTNTPPASTIADPGGAVDESESSSGVVAPAPSGPASDPCGCSDFKTRARADAVFDPDDNVSGLDGDGDGEACESL